MKGKIFGILALIAVLVVSSVVAFPFGEDDADREAIQEAIGNEDYLTWKSLMEAKLTQENFDKLVEVHNKQAGMKVLKDELKEAWENEDFERVKEIKDELAENGPEGNSPGLGKGLEKGLCENEEGCPLRKAGNGPLENKAKKSFWNRFQFWKR